MRALGISVYPEAENIDRVLAYIQLAASYGFTRIFTCLISAGESLEEIQADFGRVTACANECGMHVIADVSPDIFEKFQLDWRDLKFFKDLGLYGLRLDLGFTGFEESVMSFNPYGIKIELNASNGTKYIDNILSNHANKDQIIGCHNFYPHQYTGLSRSHFLKCSEQFKNLGIRTAAFVSSSAADHGPWPVNEGLCTVEDHRHLPIVTQAKELWQTGFIDDVIIGNAFASEEELKALGEMNRYVLELRVELDEACDTIEKAIVLEEPHFNRGDVSEYMIRSTQSRVKYKGHNFRAFSTPDIEVGDLLLESSLYERYAGEFQLALKPMKNTGKTNVVGRVVSEEHYLLSQIQPWQKFKCVLK